MHARRQRGRPPFPVESLLRIHFMQQWFTLNEPAMDDALDEVPLFRDFAGLGGWDDRLPDESTILRFRHVLEECKLAERILATVNLLLCAKGLMLRSGTVVDATLISAPSSTKNSSGERAREVHQSKKGQQWLFGMKGHIGRFRPGSHRARHGRAFQRCGRGQHFAARARGRCLWRSPLPGGAQAT